MTCSKQRGFNVIYFIRRLVLVPCIGLLVACSGGGSQGLIVMPPANSSHEDISLINAATKQLQAACPGINKYARDIAVEQVTANQEHCSVEIRVVVADSTAIVPSEYRAQGHHCAFHIGFWSPPGVTAAKDACGSICTGNPQEYKGRGFFIATRVAAPPTCIKSMPPIMAGVIEPAQVKMLVTEVDASSIAASVGGENHSHDRISDGRDRQRWTVGDLVNIEVIGNDQSNADILSWMCTEYDEHGSALSNARPESACRAFAIKILNPLVSDSKSLVDYLLARGERFQPGGVTWEIDDFRFESDRFLNVVRRIHRAK